LDITDADVLEEVDVFMNSEFRTCEVVAITLIKIRLLLELRNLKNSYIIRRKVP
jgi:hypothetical protein